MILMTTVIVSNMPLVMADLEALEAEPILFYQ